MQAARRLGLVACGVAGWAAAACGSSGAAPSGADGGEDANVGAEAGAGTDTGAGDDASARDGAAGEAGRDTGGTADAGAEAGPIGDPSGVQALPVLAFLDSLGVCTHIAQGVDSAGPVATAMTYAGLRNLRDDGRASAVPDWITVHQQSGARVDMLPSSDIPTTIGMAKQLQAAGALLAVEGPNEPNNFPVTYQGQTSSSTTFVPVASFQRDLYTAVKAEPTLAGVPVFHSSEAGGSEPDDVGLQFLVVPADAGVTVPAGTAYADFANTHNYVCGHSNQLVDNTCWNAEDPTRNGDWDGLYVEYGVTWAKGFPGYDLAALPGVPRVTTETGWVTSGTGAITEEQQGRLFLNLYLAAIKRGWLFTFIYMLRDDPVQGYWGLFDTGYQPKRSGTYLHNLTTVLADPVAPNDPGKLDYAIPAEPATVHDLLLQKHDGTFELAVWDEHPQGGSDAVTVDLKKVRPHVKVYDPTTGTAAVQTLTNVSSLPLTLSDHPVIVEL